MIYDLMEDFKEEMGKKAGPLSILKQKGYNVPDGFVISSKAFLEWMKYNNIEDSMKEQQEQLNNDNIGLISQNIIHFIEDTILPDSLQANIGKRLDSSKKYAVRSSGLKEDTESLSFAGQYHTFLNRTGKDQVFDAVIHCYKSMFEVQNLTYLLNHQIELDRLEMAILVQEMVSSEVSGIAFTINPLSGNDKEIIFELADGLGDQLVSGQITPDRYLYNWYEGRYETRPELDLIDSEKLSLLTETLLRIQMFFGYPCDIEFAFQEEELFILQARPITKLSYHGICDQWTNANFKDGGVSARVCKTMTWSLYEYVWEYILKKFLLDSKLLSEKHLRKLGNIFYGRPYWNLSVIKEAMLKVPGFIEREFDEELGVTISYEGKGRSTKITPKVLATFGKVIYAQIRIAKHQNRMVRQYKDQLMTGYQTYEAKLHKDMAPEELIQTWYQLVKEAYLQSESTYFWQIFINTVHQPLFKRKLFRYVSYSEYLNLIAGLENISHIMPYYDIWKMCKQIKANTKSYAYWMQNSPDQIEKDYHNNRPYKGIPELKQHIERFGYHSNRELDISYPCFCEEVNEVIKGIKDTLILGEDYNPDTIRKQQYNNYITQLQALKQKVNSLEYRKLLKKIKKMREMLWWREELKDISTRYYYLIRMYCLRLAKLYLEDGIFDDVEDIWHLSITDLFDFIEKKTTVHQLKQIIIKNKQYYISFRNYKNENEIGYGNKQNDVIKETIQQTLKGVGCNNGIVTGTARVILDMANLSMLSQGDILITHYTDTGWTSKFAMIKGLVTEHGGALCHAAIVAREYGIPCIVSCSQITKKIKDGSQITINGATGEVILMEEGGN